MPVDCKKPYALNFRELDTDCCFNCEKCKRDEESEKEGDGANWVPDYMCEDYTVDYSYNGPKHYVCDTHERTTDTTERRLGLTKDSNGSYA